MRKWWEIWNQSSCLISSAFYGFASLNIKIRSLFSADGHQDFNWIALQVQHLSSCQPWSTQITYLWLLFCPTFFHEFYPNFIVTCIYVFTHDLSGVRLNSNVYPFNYKFHTDIWVNNINSLNKIVIISLKLHMSDSQSLKRIVLKCLLNYFKSSKLYKSFLARIFYIFDNILV